MKDDSDAPACAPVSFLVLTIVLIKLASGLYHGGMQSETHSGKRVAKVRLTLTKRTVEALQPAEKSWIAWDDKLTGFGCRVQPSGTKSFIVNYRPGDGGRKAPNKRVVVGRYGRIAPDEARRKAQDLLGRVARGEDPAEERSEARGMPTLEQAFDDYMKTGAKRQATTEVLYRSHMRRCFGDWLARPLDGISRRDVEARFHLITEKNGWAVANQSISMLRSVYRRPCVDREGLRNPVELWLAGGGRYNRSKRRRISAPAEVLPCWRKGIEAEAIVPATPGHLPGRPLHWDAPRRDHLLAVGPGGPREAHPAGRGDQDGGAAGVADHPATGRHPRTATDGKRDTRRWSRGAGCFRRRRAKRGTSWSFRISIPASPGQPVRNSGSTACATALSPWRSAS